MKPYLLLFLSFWIFVFLFSVGVHSTPTLPRIIWMYWDCGEDCETLPELNRICIEQWRTMNPDWEVRVLSDNDFSDPLLSEMNSFLSTNDRRTIQLRSDLLRLHLLAQYGGIWVDASVLPLRPLDQFVFPLVEPSGAYAYIIDPPVKGRSYSTWFIASLPNSPFIVKWLNEFKLTWTFGDKQLPYFFCHQTLTILLRSDQELQTIAKNMGKPAPFNHPHLCLVQCPLNLWESPPQLIPNMLKRPRIDRWEGNSFWEGYCRFTNRTSPFLKRVMSRTYLPRISPLLNDWVSGLKYPQPPEQMKIDPRGPFCAHLSQDSFHFDFGLANFLLHETEPTKVLEIGAGLGLYSAFIQKKAKQVELVVGVEPTRVYEGRLLAGTGRYDDDRAIQIEASLFSENFPKSKVDLLGDFDLIYSIEVLERIPVHIHDQLLPWIANHTQGYLVFSSARPGDFGYGFLPSSMFTQKEWIKKWKSYGLRFMPKLTQELQEVCDKKNRNYALNLVVFTNSATKISDKIKYPKLLLKDQESSIEKSKELSHKMWPWLSNLSKSCFRAEDLKKEKSEKKATTRERELMLKKMKRQEEKREEEARKRSQLEEEDKEKREQEIRRRVREQGRRRQEQRLKRQELEIKKRRRKQAERRREENSPSVEITQKKKYGRKNRKKGETKLGDEREESFFQKFLNFISLG